MASAGNEEGEFGLQIAPMLDVMFVLLLFFMVSAGQVVKEAELGIQIPSGAGSATKGAQPITIDINEDGTVLFNTAPVGTPDDKLLLDLRERLSGAVQFSGDQPVIIAPNRMATLNRVVNVLDACAYGKVRVLSFRLPKKGS